MQNDMIKPIRIVVIGGIRTHFIKINAIQKMFESFEPEFKGKFDVIYINAAQHYDHALTCHIGELGVKFDYTLKHPSTDSFDILANMFSSLGTVIDEISKSGPVNYAIVMGDVATTAVAALAMLAKGIRVIHIEAGLRVKRGNGNEEYYRTISDYTSDICFAATKEDYANLINENYLGRAVFSGDIIYDFVKKYIPTVRDCTFDYIIGNEKNRYEHSRPYVLASLHHVENIERATISGLFAALKELDYDSIFIAHPRIRKFLADNSINIYGALIVDAIPYLDNLRAIKGCEFCITDSGGIQREAYYMNKRCVVRSDLTVWPTIVRVGSNIVCGQGKEAMLSALEWAKSNAKRDIPYDGCFGDGTAVRKIFESIMRHYNETF